MIQFPLRDFQLKPRKFLAILSQNPDLELGLVDRRGKVLFVVHLPAVRPQKSSNNVNVNDSGRHFEPYKPNSVNVNITQEEAYEEQPHFTPIEPWTP